MRPDNSASTRKLIGEKKILVEGKGGNPFADLIKEGCWTADREWKTVYEWSYPPLILPSGDTQTREGRPKNMKNMENKKRENQQD